jgi:hypothetical protein
MRNASAGGVRERRWCSESTGEMSAE